MTIPQGPNQRWSLDFVSDAMVDGKRFRILPVLDEFSRDSLAAVVDNSASGERVGREWDGIALGTGYSCMIVSDNGTERTSNASLSGGRTLPSAGIRSHPKSQRTMDRWRASTGFCAMNVSMSTSSPATACEGDYRKLERRQ
jgi:transposase InsO family protein